MWQAPLVEAARLSLQRSFVFLLRWLRVPSRCVCRSGQVVFLAGTCSPRANDFCRQSPTELGCRTSWIQQDLSAKVHHTKGVRSARTLSRRPLRSTAAGDFFASWQDHRSNRTADGLAWKATGPSRNGVLQHLCEVNQCKESVRLRLVRAVLNCRSNRETTRPHWPHRLFYPKPAGVDLRRQR